ncbi:MAG: TolC family protein [Balneolaceae bacterium]|nr:TolC family protein [Balneolaceae bacterium]
MKSSRTLGQKEWKRASSRGLVWVVMSLWLAWTPLSVIAQSSGGSSATPTTNAPEQVFELEETIKLAIEQSPLSRAAKYSLVASQYRYKSFRADLLPSLDLSGDVPNYSRRLSTRLEQDGSTQFIATKQSNANVELGINQNLLWTGGTISIASGMTRLGIFSDENTYLWRSTPLVVSYRQPLFQYNALKWRNRIEPLRLTIAEKQYVEELEDLSYTVTQRYFDVLLAKINLDIAQTNVAVNDSIYNISRGRFNIGTIAENDLLQSELALRNAETNLTNSQIQYDQQIKNFRLLLGLPADADFDVSIPEELPRLDVTANKALAMAQQNNSTSLNNTLQEIDARRQLEQAVRQSTFSANVIANVGFNQTAEDINEVYNDPLDQQFITLGFDIPIFNWGKARAEIQSAQNVQREVADEIAYRQAQFELAVQNTVTEFLQLERQLEIAAQSDTIALRRYEVARNRYLIGNIDITNLLIAQNERDSAKRAYIQALRTYWLGVYNLRRLTLYDFEDQSPITYELEL